MSLENLPKRRLVYESSQIAFEEKINALSDAGYTMEHYGVDPGDGEVKTFFSCIMKLKTETGEDFTGVEDIMVCPIDKVSGADALGSPLIRKVLAEGWCIIDKYKGTKDTPDSAVLVKKRKEEK